jgi:hypothetical protein
MNKIHNPYWDIVQGLPKTKNPWEDRLDIKWYGADYATCYRDELTRKFAWAIPDPDTIAFIVEHSQSIVEMGAGTGYFAWQLSQLGIDIVAYDANPPDISLENHYHRPVNQDGEPTGETRETFFAIQQGTPETLEQHSDRTLFLCWPPYDTEMASQCIEHYHGNRIIYIGEGNGGCTGNDAFHERLYEEWEQIAKHLLVQWSGIHDRAYVYTRKEQGSRDGQHVNIRKGQD